MFCLDVPPTGLTVTYRISFEVSVATCRIIGSMISGIVSPTLVSALFSLMHSLILVINSFTSFLAIMASLSCIPSPKKLPSAFPLVSIVLPSPPFPLLPSSGSGFGCLSSSARISSSIPSISVSRFFLSSSCLSLSFWNSSACCSTVFLSSSDVSSSISLMASSSSFSRFSKSGSLSRSSCRLFFLMSSLFLSINVFSAITLLLSIFSAFSVSTLLYFFS